MFDPSALLGQSLAEQHLTTLLDYYNNEGPMAIDKTDCIKEYNDFSSFAQGHAKLSQCES